MSVIAWDGISLAADKRACVGTMIRTTTKIFRVNRCLVGYAGDAAFGEQVLAWFRAGENVDDFPNHQRDKDDWAGLLVIRPDGRIQKYERTPYPLTFEDTLFAIGCGRDFALAAMYCGKSASEAVELTCSLDNGCGNGVDVLKLVEDKHDGSNLHQKIRSAQIKAGEDAVIG